MTRLFLTILFCKIILLSSVKAQDEYLVNFDFTYVNHIRTVRFHLNGLLLGYPILELGSNNQLLLTFDDLDDQFKRYTYSVVHCDANWEPSNLAEAEYIDGFLESTIDNYDFSINTITPFVHYRLPIPNRDMRFTKSGNYLLKVYEDEDDRQLVITRRFMIVEPRVQVMPALVRTNKVHLMDTHHEIDFVVNHQNLPIRNPLVDVKAHVLQNGRWDNAITGLRPVFTRPGQLIFDFQNIVVFPAGKEFRPLDLRSFRYASENVANINRTPDGFDITLLKDPKRVKHAYLDIRDINGQFISESRDDNDNFLMTDYARVLFSLATPTEYHNSDVYLLGAMTEWLIKPEFKMVYNNRINAYVGAPLLKQGYYNYYYVEVPHDTGIPDISDTEGSWFETENDYIILIYHKPFGQRYDQLVAAYNFNSRDLR
jgi:hypothetical protein